MPRGLKCYNPGGNFCDATCQICGYTSRSKTAIKLHMRTRHNCSIPKKTKENKIFRVTCGVCFKEFSNRNEARRHLSQH